MSGQADQHRRSNLKVAAFGATMALTMVGVSFAAVPLYQLFCQVTGYGGTTQRADAYSDKVLDKRILVRFDANTSGVPWTFEPVQRDVNIRIGETVQVAYKAKNTSDRTIKGTATFNVVPEMAGAYFNKVECFCFTETELKPGESIDMPVVFYVDPDIVNVPELKAMTAITLSYTFFPVDEKATPVASATVDSKVTTSSTTK